jgi:hypothetical protein
MDELERMASRRGMLGLTAVGVGCIPSIANALEAPAPDRLAASPDLRAQSLSEPGDDGPLRLVRFTGNETSQFASAIAEASTSRNGGLGHTVSLPRGVLEIDAPFNCPDRVSIIGMNKRGTVIRPSASFVGDYMASAINGTVSMFDNALERLTLDCNHVAGLGGIVADAWQEGGGLEKVLIEKFTTEGVRVRNGYGGAAHTRLRDFEIMGSNRTKATCGIKVEQVSRIGAFILHLSDGTITGSPQSGRGADDAFWLDHGIHVENDSLICTAVHFEATATGIFLDGDGHHILHGVTGARSVTNLIEIASTFAGTFDIKGCRRWGATNLLKDNRIGGLGTIANDADICSRQPVGPGGVVAAGVFDGTGTPRITSGFGVTSITRNSKGDYTLNLSTRGRDPNDFALFASHNGDGGRYRCDAAGVSSCRLYTYDAAGTPADQNQVKFYVIRVAF